MALQANRPRIGVRIAIAARHPGCINRIRGKKGRNMLKKKLGNKLVLSKTTLRVLCANDLKDIVGGTQTTDTGDTRIVKICRSDFNCATDICPV
jgi:hypothetical protein